MKKVLSLVLAAVMILCAFAGCTAKEQTDMEYVKDKGTLVVGVTVFEPMDYQDENGEWKGFDADLTKKFAEHLGVEVQFQKIEWGNKISELDTKAIDVVWNGMTLTDEVKAGMETSNPYCKNAQVVVVRKDVADQYQTLESVKTLKYAVEDGSAGEEQVAALGAEYVEVEDQALALTEVKAGTSGAAVIDLLMAGAMIGEGTDYAELTYTVSLNSEEYGVGFRKGSDLAAELNEFLKSEYASGDLMELATEYGVQESLIEQK